MQTIQLYNSDVILFMLLAVALIFVAEGIILWAYQLKTIKIQKAYAERQYNLERLREEEYHKSKEYIEENESKIKYLEEQLRDSDDENLQLKEKIERLRCANRIAEIDINERSKSETMIRNSAIYKEIQKSISLYGGTPLKEEQWEELTRIVDTAYVDFSDKLLHYCKLSAHEFRVCLLIKIGIRPQEISNITSHSKQSISTTRNRLFKRVFGDKGSGKDWDDFIVSL